MDGVRERPILFSASMVLALLNGTKTQTRRVIRLQTGDVFDERALVAAIQEWRPVFDKVANRVIGKRGALINCPYGKPGDQLWVREAWRTLPGLWDDTPPRDLRTSSPLRYEADGKFRDGSFSVGKLRPGMFMCRGFSRIQLEVVSVRIQRLHEISEVDAVAEGIRISSAARASDTCYGIYECRMPDGKTHFNDSAYELYRILWDQINGAGEWAKNPLVWAVGFKVISQ